MMRSVRSWAASNCPPISTSNLLAFIRGAYIAHGLKSSGCLDGIYDVAYLIYPCAHRLYQLDDGDVGSRCYEGVAHLGIFLCSFFHFQSERIAFHSVFVEAHSLCFCSIV